MESQYIIPGEGYWKLCLSSLTTRSTKLNQIRTKAVGLLSGTCISSLFREESSAVDVVSTTCLNCLVFSMCLIVFGMLHMSS